MCGELAFDEVITDTTAGSSPRVWGTRYQVGVGAVVSRFIPTCVGNSTFSLPSISTLPVHPHVCGELYSQSFTPLFCFGSSPRVWGTLLRLHKNFHLFRFIPTCVGNSTLVSPEDTITYGSSPRVWGTLCLIYVINKEIGFRIPLLLKFYMILVKCTHV